MQEIVEYPEDNLLKTVGYSSDMRERTLIFDEFITLGYRTFTLNNNIVSYLCNEFYL